MHFTTIIKMSLTSLNANRVRSFLTVLGIIIGISSVIIIMSVGAGAQSLILNQIQKVGSNLIAIMPGASDEEGPPASAMGISVTTLKYEDGRAIVRQIPEITALASSVQGIETATWQNQKIDITYIGTTANYPQVEDVEIASGHFFSLLDETNLSRVAVLGSGVAEDLFSGTDPIGQTIKIKRENFKIIGVFKERGKVAFQSPDEQIFIPLQTAQKILIGIKHVNLMRAKVADGENIEFAVIQVKQLLRDRHGIIDASEDDFSVRNQAEAIGALTTITNALNFFLAAMAGISLIVGGIGIMNIMYVNVTERTREIGLRKAVGATSGNVLSQFLIESIVITIFGGILGIIIGILLSGLVALVANYLGYTWKFIVTPLSIIVGVVVSTGIGIIFGYFPSKAAAKLDPIDALRYE